jgi:hypothetical protein
METTEIDRYIVGRVYPQIYAFVTNEVPNSLKVGDTYRPIDVRLSEWRRHYKHLDYVFSDLAVVNKEDKDVNDVFFRDYSVHQFLIGEKNRSRLIPENFKQGVYYSQEFFKDADKEDVIGAIKDIKRSYRENEGIYQFYKVEGKNISKNDAEIERNQEYKLRNIQEDTVNKFISAISKGRTKMLMYAVMRFGKSFTAMYCAKEIGAKLVVVVSGKIDVEEEWRKTVLGLKNFEGYSFLVSKDLGNYDAISKKLNESNVVVFVSLQDLQGPNIKPRHRELFDSHIDLLIVDETHFGARAEEYGKILKNSGLEDKQIKEELKQQGFDAKKEENAQTHIKALNAKYRIDLSGTPYRILMNSEYSKDDIIAFYQYSDIVDEQKKWDEKFLTKEVYDNDDEKDGYIANNDVQEWDNPYYGFPQMIRFAFNPNESSVNMMKELEDKGLSSSLSELMRPISIEKDDNNKYKEFVHKKEVLDLFQVIDGSKDDKNVLGFLDYDKIKNGKMCRHIVCVLPFCASCDALKEFLITNKDKFKNLNDYEIINIAGFDDRNAYPSVRNVTSKIEACEKRDKKTISLTVGKMLTGTTVKEWDTMIFLKDTSSPQEYDQATFRIQNQYVTTKKSADGTVIKYNMKPQTLLVDFSPNRMFYLQGEKSLIYNLNVAKSGNSNLQERLKKELAISPIIFVNRNKLQQAVPKDIIKAVCEYSANIDIVDDIKSIGIDASLLDIPSIKEVIESQSELGSRGGFQTKAVEGKGDDLEKPDAPEQPTNPDTNNTDGKIPEEKTKDDSIRKKFETYYSRILFYAFLTKSRVISLQEINASISGNNANERIIEHLELNKDVLQLIAVNINYSVKQSLDEAIFKTNTFANDESVDVLERSLKVMNKFPRLSETEIATPAKIAEKMVATIPESAINSDTKILDIASKEGEFALALYSKYGETIKKNIYSIPTSYIAYEFTRKMYENLKLPLENILPIYSPELINVDKKETIKKKLKDMKFDVIIGNPPYQIDTKDTSDNSMYYRFVDVAYDISPKVCLITPARFLFNAGKTPKQWNKKMLNDKHFSVISYNPKSSEVFPDIELKGGVTVTYRDADKDFGAIGLYTQNVFLNTILKLVINKKDFKPISNIIYLQNKFNLECLYSEFPNYKEIIGSNGREKRLTTNIFELLDVFTQIKKSEDQIEIIGLISNVRCSRFIEKKYLESHKNTDCYKVLLPKTNNSGQLGEALSSPFVAGPGIGYTQSFIGFGYFKVEYEAENVLKYIKTKFARTLLGTLKVTQDNNKATWQNVPIQDFTSKSDINWSKSIPEIDKQLYEKYGLSKDEITFVESMIKPMD